MSFSLYSKSKSKCEILDAHVVSTSTVVSGTHCSKQWAFPSAKLRLLLITGADTWIFSSRQNNKEQKSRILLISSVTLLFTKKGKTVTLIDHRHWHRTTKTRFEWYICICIKRTWIVGNVCTRVQIIQKLNMHNFKSQYWILFRKTKTHK